MTEVTTIGMDLAKSIFQVHGVDASEKPVVRRQLRRRQVLGFFKKLPPCLYTRLEHKHDGWHDSVTVGTRCKEQAEHLSPGLQASLYPKKMNCSF